MSSRAFILWVCMVCTVSLEAQDLRVLRQSSSSIIVEFIPRFETSRGNREENTVWFEGAMASRGTPGTAILPYRAMTVHLQGDHVRLRILEAAFRDRSNLRPRTHPAFMNDEQLDASAEPRGLVATGQSGFAPGEMAEIADGASFRGEFTGTLRIFPLQYDEERTVIRQYDRIVIAVESEPAAPQKSARSRTHSMLQQGEWLKIGIQESGIYRLDLAWFSAAGISPPDLSNMNSIRIFGNGGQPLPEGLTAPKPDGLLEVPRLLVDQNGDGVFNQGDYVLFYGRSPRLWKYNPSAKTFNHVINPYTETDAYFITYGGGAGRGMDSVASLNSPSPYRPATVQGLAFVEEERTNLLKSGRQWVGQTMDGISPVSVYSTLLPGLADSFPVVYRMSVLGRSASASLFTVQEGSVTLGSIPILPVNLTSLETEYAYRAPVTTFMRTGALVDNRSVFRLSFQTQGGEGWLDWFELLYRRMPVAVNDVLEFFSSDTSAVMEYRLAGFSSRAITIFDVTDHDSVFRITNLELDPLDPTACTFQIQGSSGSARSLVAVGPNGFKTPGPAVRIDNSDLKGISPGVEFLIITPKAFRAEADRLRAHREQQDSMTGLSVEIDAIFNEYGGGLVDPMAVRNFLADALSSWATPPKYVLFFGDGHYDYKGLRTSSPNWIPTYESVESIHRVDSYSSDDPMIILAPGNPRVSVAAGRLPVNSADEARMIVDKIIAYETASMPGNWRNRVTFVADDGLTSRGEDDGNVHTFQAEVLAQTYTPAYVDKKKIYIVEYPTVNSSSGRRKPAANAAILDAMNSGTVLLNYTGHGNPSQWAHESIFTGEAGVSQLVNGDRLFTLVAATCDFARFDDPTTVSAGEQLLTMKGGGAISIITASRAVYSSDNFQFNNTLYTRLFQRDTAGSIPRIGDALFRTKQIHYDLNDLKYHLFGDPTVRLPLPAIAAGVDSADGKSLTSLVPIQALGKVQIKGEIRRLDGSRWSEFTGRVLVEMNDARRTVVVPEWNNYSYVLPGALLYRGEVSVNGGLYSATIPVPKDVSYSSSPARVSVYAWMSSADAVGYSENVIVSGTDSAAVSDTTGPQISIVLDDDSFRSGDVVSPDPVLIVRLFDVNGMNTSTAGVGHRLQAILQSTGEVVELGDQYRGDLDTYQSGSVRQQLRGLPAGKQSLEVSAWDTYNNSASQEIFFDVRSASDLRMYNVFNFPNPVSRSTVFTFQRNSTEPIDVEVKVFTVAGRLISSVRIPAVIERLVKIPWEGRDANGDPISNGVYFYKIITRPLNGSGSEEAIGKLTMLR